MAYSGTRWRGEAMAIAGNYQVSPDAFRERGYSAYLEWLPRARLALGAWSLVTHADEDVNIGTPWRPRPRSVHPLGPRRPSGRPRRGGPAALVAAPRDEQLGAAGMLRPTTKYSAGAATSSATGELLEGSPGKDGPSAGAWGSLVWFLLPHVDLRGDFVWQSLERGGARGSVTNVIGQLHIFL